jgi:hypothetical protein
MKADLIGAPQFRVHVQGFNLAGAQFNARYISIALISFHVIDDAIKILIPPFVDQWVRWQAVFSPSHAQEAILALRRDGHDRCTRRDEGRVFSALCMDDPALFPSRRTIAPFFYVNSR